MSENGTYFTKTGFKIRDSLVKRYFPYVEKLMPTIKFLRDTLNFGDGLIRKLCALKDVSVKGDLYSTEFRQHFKADGAVCSLK